MRKLLPTLFCLVGCAIDQAPTTAATQSLVLPSTSKALDLGEGQVRILADKALTGGGWAALERTEPSGTRTALHRHNRMDEAFYVVSGTFTVFVEGKLHQLTAGAFILIPRGTPHAQGNSSAGEVKNRVILCAGWMGGVSARQSCVAR